MGAVDELRDWFRAYSSKMRMEYGHAMNLAGFDPNIILAVQQEVARNMIAWLDFQSWDDQLRQ